MSWFNQYTGIYQQVAAGSAISPPMLTPLGALGTQNQTASDLLATVSGDMTPSSAADLSGAFSSVTSQVQSAQSHVLNQAANFGRYSAAARQARMVQQAIAPVADACADTTGAFGVMLGAVNDTITAIQDKVDEALALLQDLSDAINGGIQAAIDAANAAIDAAVGAIVSAISAGVSTVLSAIAGELSDLGVFVETSEFLGNTMTLVSGFLSDPCARAIIEQTAPPETLAILEALPNAVDT